MLIVVYDNILVTTLSDVCFYLFIFRIKGKYGQDGDKFTYTCALVFLQCIINACFAKVGKF